MASQGQVRGEAVAQPPVRACGACHQVVAVVAPPLPPLQARSSNAGSSVAGVQAARRHLGARRSQKGPIAAHVGIPRCLLKALWTSAVRLHRMGLDGPEALSSAVHQLGAGSRGCTAETRPATQRHRCRGPAAAGGGTVPAALC